MQRDSLLLDAPVGVSEALTETVIRRAAWQRPGRAETALTLLPSQRPLGESGQQMPGDDAAHAGD